MPIKTIDINKDGHLINETGELIPHKDPNLGPLTLNSKFSEISRLQFSMSGDITRAYNAMSGTKKNIFQIVKSECTPHSRAAGTILSHGTARVSAVTHPLLVSLLKPLIEKYKAGKLIDPDPQPEKPPQSDKIKEIMERYRNEPPIKPTPRIRPSAERNRPGDRPR